MSVNIIIVSPSYNSQIGGAIVLHKLCDILNQIGTNSSVKEKTNICSDVIIGMNGVVVKDITAPGTYVGIPCKNIANIK